ncbi:uncharacterized protein EHS24_008138 [Apiotrichum porosum]|uniref:Uncharacterized protein n=1 Tax=Apiotrichum porosum TaxID=105984 RepID=A0A427XT68_9TREE|nr:uncharacterized protein EHS24_008138 [Apiotrichum porosum]RSH81941.1 hypothetical protein EHS24_008138 [Apiotrichum porosum]
MLPHPPQFLFEPASPGPGSIQGSPPSPLLAPLPWLDLAVATPTLKRSTPEDSDRHLEIQEVVRDRRTQRSQGHETAMKVAATRMEIVKAQSALERLNKRFGDLLPELGLDATTTIRTELRQAARIIAEQERYLRQAEREPISLVEDPALALRYQLYVERKRQKNPFFGPNAIITDPVPERPRRKVVGFPTFIPLAVVVPEDTSGSSDSADEDAISLALDPSSSLPGSRGSSPGPRPSSRSSSASASSSSSPGSRASSALSLGSASAPPSPVTRGTSPSASGSTSPAHKPVTRSASRSTPAAAQLHRNGRKGKAKAF